MEKTGGKSKSELSNAGVGVIIAMVFAPAIGAWIGLAWRLFEWSSGW